MRTEGIGWEIDLEVPRVQKQLKDLYSHARRPQAAPKLGGGRSRAFPLEKKNGKKGRQGLQ
eukprot:9368864-Lingulodinium_polyedra.AAC.1